MAGIRWSKRDCQSVFGMFVQNGSAVCASRERINSKIQTFEKKKKKNIHGICLVQLGDVHVCNKMKSSNVSRVKQTIRYDSMITYRHTNITKKYLLNTVKFI